MLDVEHTCPIATHTTCAHTPRTSPHNPTESDCEEEEGPTQPPPPPRAGTNNANTNSTSNANSNANSNRPAPANQVTEKVRPNPKRHPPLNRFVGLYIVRVGAGRHPQVC